MNAEGGAVDIFHPLATIQWEELSQLPGHVSNVNCVLVNGRLHVGGGYMEIHDSKIFVSSSDFLEWTSLDAPIGTKHFALTTYKSQLVLVGGKCASLNPTVITNVTNKLWTRNADFNKWEELLPPMQIERYWPSAVNVGSPEALVVAGGRGKEGQELDVVEVLMEEEWSTVQPLPKKCYGIKTVIHNERLYLVGGNRQNRLVFFCKVKSITDKEIKFNSLWNNFTEAPSEAAYMASFQQELIAITERNKRIFAHHSLSKCWVYVGDTSNIRLEAPPFSFLPRNFIAIGSIKKISKLFKVSLKVSSYDPDSKFTRCSLSKLEEGAGIKIVAPLSGVYTSLMSVTGVVAQFDHSFSDESKVEQVIKQWTLGNCSEECPPTWKSMIDVLKKLDFSNLGQQIENHLYGKLDFLASYRQVLAAHECIEMWFIKVILLGAPRLGKTTARRRLTGEISDISSSGEAEQPSTGAVESAPSVVIRNLSSTTALVTPTEWTAINDLPDEARMLLEFFYSHTQEKMENESSLPSPTIERDIQDVSSRAQSLVESHTPDSPKPITISESSIHPLEEHVSRQQPQAIMSEMTDLFRRAVGPKYWKDIKHLFKDTAFLKMEDTGGQPEFMDMLPALTIGPALYLLFCKLIDDLKSCYTVSYLSPSGESTKPVQSTYTVEHVLLTALASISCFKSYSTPEEESAISSYDELLKCDNSLAYIVGTFKDKVSEQQIDAFDKELQRSIRSTDFFDKDLVRFSSEDRMILPIDNMSGGENEIKKIRRFLEEGMKQHFKKLSIPAAWLVLSLCLRKSEERRASLQSVLQLAAELGMSEKETKLALWFLHHYAGVLMYFPMLEELKDTVICDTQIVYDSATNLIVNTFKFGQVGKAASEIFRKTGQFSLEDIRKATANVSGDYIPIKKLVKLLEHLNIIAPIVQANSTPTQTTSPLNAYFMPCVLQNATHEELDMWWASVSNPLSPAPLFIHYTCGYVPIGIFSAMIANLKSQDSVHLITEGIRKNKVQFQFGCDFDTVTLISQPQYYAIHITRTPGAETPAHELCSRIRQVVESTLKIVKSQMNYSFCAEYQLSFECPSHPGREHLCVVEDGEKSPRFMRCLNNLNCPTPIKMLSQHLEWFKKLPLCDEVDSGVKPKKGLEFEFYVSSLPDHVRPHLERELDWDHERVEKDLCKIADCMINWEEKLSSALGLTEVDVHDIKATNRNSPPLQRREALRKWKTKQSFKATYGNLLKLFVKAKYLQGAEVICEVLRGKI